MTIDTSREAVEQINEELSWDDSLGAIELINALLAERDAALAEVARLSHALAAETAKREAMEAALAGLIEHAHNCERELTEDLHHVDFCGESLPLTAARAILAKHGSK